MSPESLLSKMAEQRQFWVTLSDGKRVQLRRPTEIELPAVIDGIGIEIIAAHACGWDGFTEAVLLGAGIGGSDAVPFDAGLWRAYAADHVDDLQAAASGMAEAVSAYLLKKADVAKNSKPSST